MSEAREVARQVNNVIAFRPRGPVSPLTRGPLPAGPPDYEEFYDSEAVEVASLFEEMMAAYDPPTFWSLARQVRDRIDRWPIGDSSSG